MLVTRQLGNPVYNEEEKDGRSTKLRPVEFVSKHLSETQQRWAIREKEAWAIVYSLGKFDHCVRGRKVIVHTDHQSLKWLLTADKGRLARWATILS